METRSLHGIVFIHVKLPIAVNDRQLLESREFPGFFIELNAFSKELETRFFDDESKGIFIKIAEGAFLVDEDAWYPNIRAMMAWCDGKKFPYAILPVGDSAATFSGGYQGVIGWLRNKEKRARLSTA